MSALPLPVIWLVAGASVVLLLGAGYVFAAARLRARLEASRGEVASLQGRIAGAKEDPFGELKVLTEQLHRIHQRV
ncbi:MAG: hypothetical protein RBU30_18095, partial [Polyangia bacterium]|nr:hypothetical protein [Polyangia bacterium]